MFFGPARQLRKRSAELTPQLYRLAWSWCHDEDVAARGVVPGYTFKFEFALYDASDADVVPSGVAELAKLQAEGYVYIKP